MINLSKGSSFNLDKGLSRVRVGLAWNEIPGGGLDADISAAVLKGADPAARKFLTDSHFVFYNNKATPDGAVKHSGDNRTGAGDGDDESLVIDLSALSAEVSEVAIIASIHEGDTKKQDWAMLNATATLYDDTNGKVLATYSLGTDYAGQFSVQPVSLYREGGTWVFKALGAGYAFGLGPFVDKWKN